MTEPDPPTPDAARWPGPVPGELVDPAEVTGADLDQFDAEIHPERLAVRVYVETRPGQFTLAARTDALRWPGGAACPQIRVVVDLGADTIADVIISDPARAALDQARRARSLFGIRPHQADPAEDAVRERVTREHFQRWAAGLDTHPGEDT